jgi:hypothetical protein
MDANLREGISFIENDFIKYVIEYLKTGVFNKPNNKKTIEAYSYLYVADSIAR